MRIKQFKDLENCSKLYTGGWFLNTFALDELNVEKVNEKSIRFQVKTINLCFEQENVDITSSKGIRTIKKENIVYSKIPYFTTREEAVDFFIDMLKDELAKAKEKVEYLPKLIDKFTEVLKEE